MQDAVLTFFSENQRMTSEKDNDMHRTEKLSQLKDRLDKEGLGTHGACARLLPALAPLGPAPSTSVIATGFGHLPYSSTCTRLCSTRGRLYTRVDQVGSSNLNTPLRTSVDEKVWP